jgi:Aldo/keto reductases, related to diketogulonate reductase
MDYVNLYLMHWPHAFRSGGDLVPFKADGKFDFDDSVDYVDVWKTMECLVDEGLARSIGVSNFNTKQLETLLGVARIKPVTNQARYLFLVLARDRSFSEGQNIL